MIRSKISAALLLAAVALATSPSEAQQPASQSASVYPACQKPPSKAEVDAAHGAYVAGRHSFDEGDYATAIVYFKDAYRRDCTKHELLPIIARAYELSQNRAEAILSLETFLKRAPANDPQVEAIKKRISNLKALEAKAPLSAPSASTAAPPPPPLSSEPSPAHASASSPAPSPQPPPPEPAERRPSIAPWLLVGVGGVGAVVGTLVLAGGLSKRADAVDRCPNEVDGQRRCPEGVSSASVTQQFDEGESEATVGGVVLGVSVAAMVGGIVWLVLDRKSTRTSSPSASPAVPWRAAYSSSRLNGASYVVQF